MSLSVLYKLQSFPLYLVFFFYILSIPSSHLILFDLCTQTKSYLLGGMPVGISANHGYLLCHIVNKTLYCGRKPSPQISAAAGASQLTVRPRISSKSATHFFHVKDFTLFLSAASFLPATRSNIVSHRLSHSE